MAHPGDLILVHMLELQEVGSYFDRHRWPLHITLLPWFRASPEQRQQLRQSLTRLAQTVPPATVTVGAITQFGPNKDILVNLIADQTALATLHQALFDLTRMLGMPLVSSEWTGPNFTAHIGRYEDRYADAGDAVHIGDFYLVTLLDGSTCQILGRFELKGWHG